MTFHLRLTFTSAGLAGLLLLVSSGACSSSGSDDGPLSHPPIMADGGGDSDTDAASHLAAQYPDIGALHDQAVSRTCALNNGVCHNSKQYPDFHTVSDFIADTVGRPCNAQVDDRSTFRDACETPGDHLVIPTMMLDQEILTVDVTPATGPVTAVTLNLGAPVGTAPVPALASAEIHRGTTIFKLAGAVVKTAAGKAVTLSLTTANAATKALLDDRVYPWNALMVRVADVNRNGVAGASLGVKLVTPGKPMQSFVIMRLMDPAQGEVMPAVCREWSDDATKALGCWIEGLKVDSAGNPTNAAAPIDYASCNFNPAGTGRCSQSTALGFPGVTAIFAQQCGGSGCHIGESSPAANLDLGAGKALPALVRVASGEVPSMPRVDPGHPENSYLLCKMDPACAARSGTRMPKDAPPIADSDLATVRNWIAAGATGP